MKRLSRDTSQREAMAGGALTQSTTGAFGSAMRSQAHQQCHRFTDGIGERGAFARQLHPARHAPEQAHLEKLFELPYLLADRRLGNAKLLGGGGEIAVTRGRIEHPEQIERRQPRRPSERTGFGRGNTGGDGVGDKGFRVAEEVLVRELAHLMRRSGG